AIDQKLSGHDRLVPAELLVEVPDPLLGRPELIKPTLDVVVEQFSRLGIDALLKLGLKLAPDLGFDLPLVCGKSLPLRLRQRRHERASRDQDALDSLGHLCEPPTA